MSSDGTDVRVRWWSSLMANSLVGVQTVCSSNSWCVPTSSCKKIAAVQLPLGLTVDMLNGRRWTRYSIPARYNEETGHTLPSPLLFTLYRLLSVHWKLSCLYTTCVYTVQTIPDYSYHLIARCRILLSNRLLLPISAVFNLGWQA